VIFLAARLAGPQAQPADAEGQAFLGSCETQCSAVTEQHFVCHQICVCVAARTKQEALWRPMMDARLSPAQHQRVDAITQQCAQETVQ
jgi:hypothetical protein